MILLTSHTGPLKPTFTPASLDTGVGSIELRSKATAASMSLYSTSKAKSTWVVKHLVGPASGLDCHRAGSFPSPGTGSPFLLDRDSQACRLDVLCAHGKARRVQSVQTLVPGVWRVE